MNRIAFAVIRVIAAATLALGCASGRIREAAEVTLNCSKGVRVKENLENKGWVADGCGRQAFCVVPPVEGADVQCAGGAPPRPVDD